ncbi:MAG: hypothetical protein H9535_12860, partial [Ignavibacteria bacterium]|nr:hypothetical protein [Ignavibacteria bacterium]
YSAENLSTLPVQKMGGSSEFPSSIKQWSVTYGFKPTKLPANVDSNFKQPKDLYQAIYDKALVCLNKKAEYNFSTLPQSTPILFAVDLRVRNKFEAAFKDKYPRAKFYDMPIKDVKGKREEILATLKRELPNFQYAVLTVITKQHKDILALLSKNDNVRNKLVVFFHNNPCLIDVDPGPNVIPKQRVTLLGNFDYNSSAFDSDIKVLQGTINPRSITTDGVGILPVSIDGLYNVTEYVESWKAAEGFAPIPFYNTDREKLLFSNVMKLSDSIVVLNRRITVISGIRFVGLWLGVVLLVVPISWLGKKMFTVYKDSKAEGLIEEESKWYKSIFVVLWTKKQQTWKYSLLTVLCLLTLTGILYLIDPRIPTFFGKWIVHLVRKILDIPSDSAV